MVRDFEVTDDDIYNARLLECRDSYDAGNLLAVLSGLLYCQQHDVVAPQWLLKAAYDLAVIAIRTGSTGKKGRHATIRTEIRERLMDLARFYAVEEIARTKAAVDVLHTGLDGTAKTSREEKEHVGKLVKRFGKRSNRQYETASEELLGTEAYIGPDAVKTSYLKVAKISDDPEKSPIYLIPQRKVLRDVGLDRVLHRPWNRKKKR